MMITLTREEAQQVLDALQCATPPTFSAKIVEDWQSAVEFLRARLSEPEPEPVAWMFVNKFDGGEYIFKHSGEGVFNKYEFDVKPLYTAPPQREWQSLTDEDRQELAAEQYGWEGLCSAVEAKLREKNA